ncbi:hypothetical protein GCM10017710_17620 [Arthrobacter ramosus]|uniref:hypothetical protein n=1 Tax=Arthrobacter ramosus TaxID=1672 RepID=UPI002FE99AF0
MPKKTRPRHRYIGCGGGLYNGPDGGLYPYKGGGLDPYNGGGLDRYNGGGLDTSRGGGLYYGPGGGLWDGPCDRPYRSSTPPMHIWIPLLREQGLDEVADLLASHHDCGVGHRMEYLVSPAGYELNMPDDA